MGELSSLYDKMIEKYRSQNSEPLAMAFEDKKKKLENDLLSKYQSNTANEINTMQVLDTKL